MHGKMMAKEDQRDALVKLLLETDGLAMPGCEIYIVSVSPTEPDAIWVTEVWKSEADHAASLKMENVRTIINRAKPLIAGFSESIKLTTVGGQGLSAR